MFQKFFISTENSANSAKISLPQDIIAWVSAWQGWLIIYVAKLNWIYEKYHNSSDEYSGHEFLKADKDCMSPRTIKI